MDLQSIMGYAHNSPFRNAPYLDITTPKGLITMENTPIDLMGIDNLGNVKKMKAKSKNPYKFAGTMVREIPMQNGGKAPIYTTNPNDLRLQAYTDSLILHNESNINNAMRGAGISKEVSMTEEQKKNYQNSVMQENWLKNRNRRINPHIVRGIDYVPDLLYHPNIAPNSYQEIDSGVGGVSMYSGTNMPLHPFYKKPTQPIIYQREKNMKGELNPSSGLNVPDLSNLIPSIEGHPLQSNNSPTNYSFTYPTGPYNEQKTLYAPNKESWKRFIKDRMTSSQEGENYGSATGYVSKKRGGKSNPYEIGGLTSKQMFDFLFDDEEEEAAQVKGIKPTAPTTDEVDIQNQLDELAFQQRTMRDQQNENLAMEVGTGNPYTPRSPSGTPYTGQIQSSGQFGNQNVGSYGAQIYGQLSNDLGYSPVANSIYRSKEQNDALIAAGAPAAKNSWHLTGNAIDLKPEDWHKLTDTQQLYYRKNYDVVYHDNHYHIEPK